MSGVKNGLTGDHKLEKPEEQSTNTKVNGTHNYHDNIVDDASEDAEFCDSVDDFSQLLREDSNNNLPSYLKLVQEETQNMRNELLQVSSTIYKIDRNLKQEKQDRINYEKERKDKSIESERKIQNLLSDYINKINELQQKQREMDGNIEIQKEQTNQKIDRLNQSLLLCFSRVRDSGKYQVYWGCAVFFLWCLWPFLLIKRRVTLLGVKPFGNFLLRILNKFKPRVIAIFEAILAFILLKISPMFANLSRSASNMLGNLK